MEVAAPPEPKVDKREPPTLQAMAGATGGAAAFVAPPRRAAARAANGDAAVGAKPAGGLIANAHAGGGALRAKSSCAGAVCSAGELLGRWARTGVRGREPGARAGSHSAPAACRCKVGA
eukprot:scaffold4055_cov132-Isochrysis_galbana.AAC.1